MLMKNRIKIFGAVILIACLEPAICRTGFSTGISDHSVLTNETGSADSDTLNLALKAEVSTSFVSSWEKLSAVNDGFNPATSSDKSKGAYGNWNGESDYNTYNWVQYEWELAQTLISTSVYWWDDGAGIDQPTSAYVEYWNGSSWTIADSIGTDLNKYNTLELNLRTNKIRINMISLLATGILEWKVTGIENDSTSCMPSTLTPFIGVNDNEMMQTNTAILTAGDSVSFDLEPFNAGDWSWSGPGGFNALTRWVSIGNIDVNQSGTFTACYLNGCGAYSFQYFFITVNSSSDISGPYTWPAYNPSISYNFRDEFPALSEPAMDLDDCPEVIGSQSSGWWTFRWGPDANLLVTPAAITPMLERMNADFAYFRDTLGWPPDKRAKNGYRSAIYLYGSGLCTDDEPNTATGGWQSSIFYQNQSWPMVLLSYYPVFSFDPSCKYSDREFQKGAVVHEGIHSVLADLPGCRDAGWFHEGGNTWLQQEAAARQSGSYSSMGWLNGTSLLAPFMPIECYSGWLQDDSFGGPSAEGVNMFVNNAQVCTWRNYLGGVQYSNIFPTFIGMTLGKGSVPWIWRYCESRVLEGMSTGLGELQMRHLIMEYRAKQALVDMGAWTNAMKALLDNHFGLAIKAEWKPSWLSPAVWYATPYVKTTDDGNGLLTPEYRTTPGWSGANQIPLIVSGDTVTVNFQPLSPNMTCQLCYRTRYGTPVYSNPVFGGNCSLRLDSLPANNVVIAVICNTDYVYQGEQTRKAHFDYRLQLVSGITGTASPNKRWYDWTKDLATSNGPVNLASDPDMKIYPNPAQKGDYLNISFDNAVNETTCIEILNLQGQVVLAKNLIPEFSVVIPVDLTDGLYFVTVKSADLRETLKLVIE
jgi:hypothetical protein